MERTSDHPTDRSVAGTGWPGRSTPGLLDRLVRSRTDAPPWTTPAILAIGLLAAVLYTWNLSQNGNANSYYAAAVLAATKSWKAFFFGSFDAGNFITVDKPPLSLQVMALSARVFGFSSWSMLLPEAAAGVASVLLLYDAVRRLSGRTAGLIAALVLALTPVATVMFRYNNPDALLTLLLVLSGWAMVRALRSGRTGWLLLSAAMVGLAFNTKYLQAYLVVPALVGTYAIVGPGTFGRRVLQLLGAAGIMLVTSGWWVAIVTLIPAADRPYIGGSSNNSVLNLIFGYDGFGRIFGQAFGRSAGSAPGGGVGFGGQFGSSPGWLRLFNDQIGGQVSWLIPLALAGLVGGLWLHRRQPRTDAARSGSVLWGGWFLTNAVVFSFAAGIFHPYYTVAMAPSIAALVGAGLVDLWALARRSLAGGVALAASVVLTAWWGFTLLGRTPQFLPWLGPVELTVAALAAAALLLVLSRRMPQRLATGAVVAGVVAVLAGPTAYAVDTIAHGSAGAIVSAGPAAAGSGPGRFSPGSRPTAAGGAPGLGGGPFGPRTGAVSGVGPPEFLPGRSTASEAAAIGGFRGPGQGSPVDTALTNYLVAHQGAATWIVATASANQGDSIELTTGKPVMAMGGFSGGDPALTVQQLEALVAAGKLRYVLVTGTGAPGGFDSSSSVMSWVTSHGTRVNYGGSQASGATLYDLSAAAGSAK